MNRGGPRLVLRADAGHGLGSGHVMRLTALADAAMARGGEVLVIVGGEPGPTLDHLATRRIASVPSDDATGGDDDRTRVIAHARTLGADTVVVDGPSFSPSYVLALADAGLRVASLDDLGTTPLPTTMVINHNLGAEELAACYPAAAVRMLGRPFHLLRREFRRLSPAGPPPRARARRVVITMGGSDPAGATSRALRAIGGSGLEIVVVLGPDFRCDEALTHALATAEARGHDVKVLYRPRELPAIMADCDVAVSAAGGTLAELGYLGRPTVALAIVADQVDNARRHVDRELAVCGQRLTDMADGELAAAVAELLADQAKRRRLRDRSAAALDGRGAERVIERLAA